MSIQLPKYFLENGNTPIKLYYTINSLTQLVGSSEASAYALKLFLPLLVNCNTIGILSSLNQTLPDRIHHIFIRHLLEPRASKKLPQIITITICDVNTQHFAKYGMLQRLFPNLQTVKINTISIPVELLRHVSFKNIKINATNFNYMLLVCKQLTQFQDTFTLDTILDLEMRNEIPSSNNEKSKVAFVEFTNDNKFILHNSSTEVHVKQVSLDFCDSDMNREEALIFPVLLFQRKLQLWFAKLLCLSYKLHYMQLKSPIEILKTLDCKCGQKFSGEFPQIFSNGSILIPKPFELVNLFSILFTSVRKFE